MYQIRIFELDTEDMRIDAMDSWPVIEPITDEVPGGIIGYTVGAEPESFAAKLNELNPDSRTQQEKDDNGARFQHMFGTDITNQRDFDKSVGEGGIVAIGHFGRCRVLVYALRDHADILLKACRAMG